MGGGTQGEGGGCCYAGWGWWVLLHRVRLVGVVKKGEVGRWVVVHRVKVVDVVTQGEVGGCCCTG